MVASVPARECEAELSKWAYGVALLQAVGGSEAAEHRQPKRSTGPVEGRLVVAGASRPLLVGPGDWLTHVRTFRKVEVLLAWRQSGVDWIQARNVLGRVISEQAAGFDLYEGDSSSPYATSADSFAS